MKSITHCLTLSYIMTLSSFVIIGCQPKVETPKAATPAELSQMNKDFAAALNAKDAQAAANLYAEDATLLPPGEAMVTGRENIRKYWQGGIDAGVSDVSVETISTGSDGNLGYEIGRYQLSLKNADGSVLVEKGRYVELLKRGADGKWISTCGIWNAEPEPAK